jgi:hypothetical protein
MGNLTSEQALELSNYFLTLSQTIGQYRIDNFESLSSDQDNRIKDLHWSVMMYANNFNALSTILVLDEVEESLNAINQITRNINETISHLENIQKVIDIATAVVSLGASILSTDVLDINNSIQELSDLISAD